MASNRACWRAALLLTLGLCDQVSAQVVSGRITGTIVNDAGQPVSGAVVIADNKQATPPTRSAVANREGRFGLMSLKAGFWVLLIRAPGYEPLTFTAPVTARPAPPVTLTLVSIPGGTRAGTFDGLRPASVIAALDNADRLVQARKFDEAITIYRDLLGQAPAVTSVQLALARAYHAKSDLGQARAAAEKLLASEPDNVRARYELALILEDAGEATAAVRELERIVRDAPDSAAAASARDKLASGARSPSDR